jgi:glyoxylase-like metal-dependent hydrolase (beta-lactamase superfamily II)
MTLDGTNTYVLRRPGASGAVVVDPGPLDEPHLRAVAALGPVELVLLTHGHPDHAEGAHAFREMTGAAMSAQDPAWVVGAEPLTGGARIPAGGLDLEVVPTPGHTADSVSFLVREPAPVLLTGDTVLGRGTTVVAHPDGALAPYLDSLARLRDLTGALTDRDGPVRLLPGHGPVREDAAALAREYLEHRGRRLEQVREARRGGATTAAEVVRAVYADVDRALWPAAELSVRAQLDYLDSSEG